MSRREEIERIVDKLDEDSKLVLSPLIENIVFLEERLAACRKSLLKEGGIPAPMAKFYTEQHRKNLQTYTNALKVVISALNRNEPDAAAELVERLKEFEL